MQWILYIAWNYADEHDEQGNDESGDIADLFEVDEDDAGGSSDDSGEVAAAAESPDFVPEDIEMRTHDPYPGVAKKQEIINYWLGGRDKKRKWSTVLNRYRQLTSLQQVRRWQKQIETGW